MAKDDFRKAIRFLRTGRFENFEKMLEKGFDINQTGIYGTTLLASFVKDFKVSEYLFDHGSDPNIHQDHHGTTFNLMFSYKQTKTDVVKLYLENRADPNLANNEGKTALDYVIKHKNHEMLTLFGEYVKLLSPIELQKYNDVRLNALFEWGSGHRDL
jgi:ankyrin repeat protein